jgi:(p)ppGpp synthase/HD superfamily hydrolase
MATIERALQVAARAHEGQRDKEGLPYILHSLRVMAGVEGDAAQIVAVLHDVVEDTPVTFEDLSTMGFSNEVMRALRLVTHAKSTPYADYVVAAKADPIARQVKLADLRDNARLDRTLLRPGSVDRDMARIRRYVLSYKFLTDQMDEPAYRQLMRDAEQ